jgi:predicted phage terminase large subunit-like protein
VEPDAIMAVCDTAESGSDSVSMPVGYVYGERVYIDDVVFDNSPPEVTKPACAKCLVRNKAGSAMFESNNAGVYYARDVEKLCKELGLSISITSKRSVTNKQTRIEMSSDNIKKRFYFRDPSTYERGSQYWFFMRELTTYTRVGKVPHDDAPDSLAMMENELRTFVMPAVKVINRPF